MTGDHPNADDHSAKVFQDQEHRGIWLVEKMDEDGDCELTIVSGVNA